MMIGRKYLSRPVILTASVLGAAVLVATVVAFILCPHILQYKDPGVDAMSDTFLGTVFKKRTIILEWGLFFSTILLAPGISRLPQARRGYSIAALTLSSVFFAWFIFHFGNRQFGAWDYNIVIDTGWRQILGQRAYTDFVTPNPPGFNLGIYYAFRLFGVTWNAQLSAIILFCLITFFWIYWLLRQFPAPTSYAIFLAFSVEGVTILPLCFWWYNDTTSVLAAIFLLSALLCARQDAEGRADLGSRAAWLSYMVSMGLFCLMKPNIAGLLISVVTVLLFVAVQNKRRLLLITLGGMVLCFAILFVNHVSISAMIRSYHDAAIERGGLSRFGLDGFTRRDRYRLVLWTLLLAAPLLALLPRFIGAIRDRQWRVLAFLLIFTIAVPVALYGMFTDGELKELETAVIVISCGVLCLDLTKNWTLLRPFFIAMVISMLGVTIYEGTTRERVRRISPGYFFEYSDADRPIRDRLFSSLVSTPLMDEVQSDVRRATKAFPGSTFLGPRLEFDYADMNIPSPTGWPVYYQPGTSFARRDEDRLTSVWISHKFQTLIFRNDFPVTAFREPFLDFYPDDLVEIIHRHYELQPGFSRIQVYTRRADGLSSPSSLLERQAPIDLLPLMDFSPMHEPMTLARIIQWTWKNPYSRKVLAQRNATVYRLIRYRRTFTQCHCIQLRDALS